MKRVRSPSIPSLPCLNSGRSVAVCRPPQGHAMAFKRLRGRNASSFSKSNVSCHNGAGAMMNYSNSNYNNSAVCQQAPCTPASTTEAPPATTMQFAEFFVDTAVSPTEAVSLADEMAADFYSEVSIMYDMLSDIKTPTAEGRAVDELMRRLHSVLSTSERGRNAAGDTNLSTQIANVRGLYNGLIRVFIFLYQRHFRAFVVLEVSELLAASWQRLLAFVIEYRILDEVFVRKVYDHVAQIVSSS